MTVILWFLGYSILVVVIVVLCHHAFTRGRARGWDEGMRDAYANYEAGLTGAMREGYPRDPGGNARDRRLRRRATEHQLTRTSVASNQGEQQCKNSTTTPLS